MSQTETLQKLEQVLESFLQRAVQLKENRLQIIEGINRLDNIARAVSTGYDVTEDIGQWFASHNRWLSEDRLRQAEQNRIGGILKEIRRRLPESEASPAEEKIKSEIDRWHQKIGTTKLVLKRPPEKPVERKDSLTLFKETFKGISKLFENLTDRNNHLLTILDESLKKTEMQNSRDALVLSGLIIYFLKQHDYKIEPYVKRLKEAEKKIKGHRQ